MYVIKMNFNCVFLLFSVATVEFNITLALCFHYIIFPLNTVAVLPRPIPPVTLGCKGLRSHDLASGRGKRK